MQGPTWGGARLGTEQVATGGAASGRPLRLGLAGGGVVWRPDGGVAVLRELWRSLERGEVARDWPEVGARGEAAMKTGGALERPTACARLQT
jgi:hypothetical protein